ncbi:MAG: MFS transporter [Wolbachia sp.]
MSVIRLMSSDIYLPALPTMVKYFYIRSQDIQITLSVYLLGLSVSQIIYGSLSDRFVRRPVIIIGVAITLYFLAFVWISLA